MARYVGHFDSKIESPDWIIGYRGWGNYGETMATRRRIIRAFRYILPFVKLLGGARAVLWHQGKSDVSSKTSTEVYQQQLQTVIDTTRNESGLLCLG